MILSCHGHHHHRVSRAHINAGGVQQHLAISSKGSIPFSSIQFAQFYLLFVTRNGAKNKKNEGNDVEEEEREKAK